jgi:hypothetical protein
MALLPWGKVDVGTNELPPKEATQMSREVKYIGYVQREIADIFTGASHKRVCSFQDGLR